MANALLGLGGAVTAAFMFAVQYTPVKSYEVHDGITFQWFLASGSLFATIVITAASGDLSMDCSGEGWMPFIGGMMFGLSNYLCIPLIKLLGMGVGFSMYHFINIMTGYLLGRIGFLGIPASGGLVGDIGCGIIGVSFILLANVEGDEDPPDDIQDRESSSPPAMPALGAALVPDIDQVFREQYRRWRVGEACGSIDPKTTAMLEQFEAFNPFPRSRRKPLAFFRGPAPFAALTPEVQLSYRRFPARSIHEAENRNSVPRPPMLPQTASEPALGMLDLVESDIVVEEEGSRKRRCGTVLVGVALAICTGVLTGSCATPGIKYNLDHPGKPFSSVFAMVVGFWFVATVIYIFYTIGARIYGFKVPHAPIRPSLIAGALWAVGNALNLYNPTQIAYTISYAVAIVGCLIIAGLISLLFYKEIKGRNKIAVFCGALSMQGVGVLMIGFAGASN